MSRVFTAADRSAASALRLGTFAKLEITDSTGAWVDVSTGLQRVDWLNSVTISDAIDRNAAQLSGSLLRDTGTLSLSPFRSDSLLNQVGGSYATMLDLWRRWRCSTATMREGYPPTGDDWKGLAEGRIDIIDIQDEIQISGRSEEAVLIDKWIDCERQYGSGGGIAMETVLQSMLDDNGIAVTLYCPVSPGYNMNAWTQPKDSLYSAMAAVAAKAGCVLRYRYDSAGTYRLTLFKPNRTATVEDWALGPWEYTALPQCKIDKTGIRNFIKLRYAHATLGTQTVIYPHMAGTGTVACVAGAATFSSSQAGVLQNGANVIIAGIPYTVSAFSGTTTCTLLSQLSTGGIPTFGASAFTAHGTLSGGGLTTSITRFGRVDMEIDLSFDSQVNDATNAQAMCDAVGSDMEFPNLEQQFETPGFWFVQLHDYGRFYANGVQYDTDQLAGITSIVQDLRGGTVKSTLGARGKPAGRYTQWKALGQNTVPGGTGSQVTVPLLCRVKVQTTTATQVVFRVAVSDPFPLGDVTLTYTGAGVGTIAPASPRTLTRANLTNNIDTTGTVDITVDRAAFGTGTGRITFTATAGSRISSSDAGEVPTLDRDTQSLAVRVLRVSETADQVVVRVEAITPNAGATVTINYDNGGLTVSPATGGTLTSTTAFGTTAHIDFTITRDSANGSPRRVTFTASAAGFVDSTDGVDVPPTSTRFRAKAAITISLANNSPTFFAPTTEVYDVGNLHDNATNPSHMTVPTGGNVGAWVLQGSASFANNATGYRTLAVYKNSVLTDTSMVVQAVAAGVLTALTVTYVDSSPSVGDFYELLATQTSGGPLSTTGTFTATHLP